MADPTIVTFVNEKYIPVARNWLRAVEAVGLSATARIVAMDQATRDAFPADKVHYRPCDASDLGVLWAFRVRVLRQLLADSSGLIHSDADAVWMRDPLPVLNDCAEDMVFSQGTVWPPDVHARQGLVLCCGFFYLRNNEAVHGFMAELESRVEEDRDDQVSVNRLLDESGLVWEIEEPYTIPFRGTRFSASRHLIRSKSGILPFSVAVLPHHLFPRLMDGADPNVVVGHPLSPKVCAEKISVLSELGLWL